jgi:hypothetical protein
MKHDKERLKRLKEEFESHDILNCIENEKLFKKND